MTHQPPGLPCYCNERGWMPGIGHFASPARGGYGIAEGGMRPDGAVVHTIEGWQSTMAAASWKSNSYHATFRIDGWTIQLVPIYTPAWHAGRLDSAPPTWPLYRPGVNPNAHSIGLAAEGTADPARPMGLPLAWTTAQVESAIAFLRWAGEDAGIRWDIRTLGEHSEIAVLTRRDPGPRWPKAQVLAALAASVAAKLTAEQQYVVDAIKANRESLTDAEVAAALAEVGLDAMPGEALPVSPPTTHEPKPEPAFDRKQLSEARSLLDDAIARIEAASRLIEA